MAYTYAPLETPVLTPDEDTPNPLPIVFPDGYNPEASRNIPPRWRFLQNLLLEKGVSVAASTLVVQQLARAESLNKIRLPKFQLHVVTNLEEMSRLLALQLPSSFQTVNPLILDECMAFNGHEIGYTNDPVLACFLAIRVNNYNRLVVYHDPSAGAIEVQVDNLYQVVPEYGDDEEDTSEQDPAS